MASDKTMQDYFSEAAAQRALVDVWIDHPHHDFIHQSGVCYEAHADYFVIGPEDSPGKVCIPYDSLRWFRRPDQN